MHVELTRIQQYPVINPYAGLSAREGDLPDPSNDIVAVALNTLILCSDVKNPLFLTNYGDVGRASARLFLP